MMLREGTVPGDDVTRGDEAVPEDDTREKDAT